MKKCGDSKAFTPLISVFFILLMGMAMTGCASTALVTAASEGQTLVIKDLLDKGADLEERGNCGLAGGPSSTPLLCAVSLGHLEAVKELINRGADVNVHSWGVTPLIMASYYGYADIAKLLIDGGADVNASFPPFPTTPLMQAAMSGHSNIAKLLIERGADIERAMTKLKHEDKDAYQLLERLVSKYQPTGYGTSPSRLPTALPLPTESVAPF